VAPKKRRVSSTEKKAPKTVNHASRKTAAVSFLDRPTSVSRPVNLIFCVIFLIFKYYGIESAFGRKFILSNHFTITDMMPNDSHKKA